MNSFFYSRLALGNIKKNGKSYVPYMLTCIIGIMIFYIMLTISWDPNVMKLPGGAILQTLLLMGCAIVGIFAGIFFFYTNSFLIKNRKKELALFNILGMAKRHLGRMMLVETLFTSLFSLIVGILAGVLLGRMVFMAVLKVLRVSIPIDYKFSPSAALITLGVFGAIFLVVLLCNLGRVQLSSPMQLLGGSKQGEKEPKTKWLLAVIGLLTTGIGYYIALTVESPIEALVNFFMAVILVIIGTYCLFTAGSIAFLKMLRKNKDYYYQTSHFTAVSGMLYRMKRNAAGLASICILSTMVLVVISTTVSMQAGAAGVISSLFPNDIQIRSYELLKPDAKKALDDKIEKGLQEANVKPKVVTRYDAFVVSGYRTDTRFAPSQMNGTKGKMVQMYYIALKESSLAEKYGTLEKDEILVSGNQPVELKHVKIGGTEYKIKNGDAGFKTAPTTSLADSYFIMVADQDVLKQIEKETKAKESMANYYVGIDLAHPEDGAAVLEKLGMETDQSIQVDYREDAAKDIFAMYGGLLFLGIFLGLLFLVAAVLIIYYKQISEGYEDSEHYKIMQNVGMSYKEVKESIKSQVLLVFFLPLVVAIIHMAASFNMMNKLLGTLQLTNTGLFLICTGVTILVFTLVYLIIYSITAREYYKLVK